MYWSDSPSKVHGLELVEIHVRKLPSNDVFHLDFSADLVLKSKTSMSPTLGLVKIKTLSEESLDLLMALMKQLEVDAAGTVFEKGTTTASTEPRVDHQQDDVPGI